MSDVPQQPMMGTDLLPFNTPNLNRNQYRSNAITDFFRARIPVHTVVPANKTTAPLDPPTAPSLIRHDLIPIQVIMEHQTAVVPPEDNTRVPLDPPFPPPPPPSPPPPPANLHQAQQLWAAMFRASEENTNVRNGARPIILSIENQRANTSWGDQLMEKPDNVTRVYGMNVNGLKLDQRGGQLDVLCKVINEVQADVFCGQEHNLASDNTQVRQILYHTARHHWKRSRITFGTTPIAFSNHYKPGGAFMITASDLTGRVIEQRSDKWGRWVRQVYQGRGQRTIAIYSAYQVVSKEVKLGCITAASQQQSLLMQAQDPVTNPRLAFRRDLQIEILASCIRRPFLLTIFLDVKCYQLFIS
jgi:hypothetical protein